MTVVDHNGINHSSTDKQDTMKKSVGINNDTTPVPAPNDTNTVDEVTSAEIALRNDLVLESLLSYMNRSDLLSCRAVNKQWQNEATKELRRRNLVIRFSFNSRGSQARRSNRFQDICRVISECRTPSLLSSFQVKTVSRNDLRSAGVQRIFTTLGNHMKKLTLYLNYASRMYSFEESSLMTHLQNLLFRQTPNLEFLQIKFCFPGHWKEELQTLDHQNDRNGLLLPKLKTFIVTGTAPPKVFAGVISAGVNLRSVGGVSSACLKYFMGAKGRDKVHLLKILRFQLAMRGGAQRDEGEIELMETFLMEHKQNLRLETCEIVSEFLYQITSSEGLEPRIVNAINQILECSSESLEKLRIRPMNWFNGHLIIPRLPKLQEICFDCLWSSSGGLRPGVVDFFPGGFCMNSCFPTVSSLIFLSCTANMFRQFVKSIEITEPVASVRHIIFMTDANTKNGRLPFLATDFHYVFPNLKSINCFEGEKYYKI